jgi:hypothetical protein
MVYQGAWALVRPVIRAVGIHGACSGGVFCHYLAIIPEKGVEHRLSVGDTVFSTRCFPFLVCFFHAGIRRSRSCGMLWKLWSMLWKSWSMLWKRRSMLWKRWGMLWKRWGMLWKSWSMLWKRWGMLWKSRGMLRKPAVCRLLHGAWSFGFAETLLTATLRPLGVSA